MKEAKDMEEDVKGRAVEERQANLTITLKKIVKENSSFEEYHKVSFIRGFILIIRMLYLSLMILFTYTFIFEYY